MAAENSRTLLATGAILTALGLATAALLPIARADDAGRVIFWQRAGGVVMFVGWAVLAWGIHRFGRDHSS
jgi:hypothetical protein